MKKLLSLALALMMIFSITPMSFAEEETTTETVAGLENFVKKNSYKPGQFKDFLSSDWFSANVITAYELGLVKGTTETNFNPKGNITVAETIVLACRLHNIYNGGTGEFTQGSPWYQVYVDYALKNKIIPGTYSDYNAKISRANFAYFLNNALPKEALKEINNIPDGALKDVAEDNKADAIYTLYRAGVLTGSDKYGTFNPNSNIQRSEVATIVTRMADRTQRKMFILEEKTLVPESVTLAGNTSILIGETTQWKATIVPSGANQWVSWNSGNPGVATVDANGNIKGLKAGQSNITATAVNGVKKTVLITVKSIQPTELTLAGKTRTYVGEKIQWNANKWVWWTSGNPSVATIDQNGNIKALKAGVSNITATAADGTKKSVLLTIKNSAKNSAHEGYGRVKGQLTYQYNKFVGTRGDNGAIIMLIPKNTEVKNYDNALAVHGIEGEYNSGIIVRKCDGYGNFDTGESIVPAGEYILVGISKNTTSGARFANSDSWKKQISDRFNEYLSAEDIDRLMLCMGFKSLVVGDITVEIGKELTLTHDFGYTYI